MANETNPGYLVQLQNPEGDNVYPVVTAEGIVDSDGKPFDSSAISAPGNLYLWEKTTVVTDAIPAGYTLGDVQTGWAQVGGYSVYNAAHVDYYTKINVSDIGWPSGDETTKTYVEGATENDTTEGSVIRGCFVVEQAETPSSAAVIWYIPKDATVKTCYSTSGRYNHYYFQVDKYQVVKGYPITPPGTSKDYLTSANRNAYTDTSVIKYIGKLGEKIRAQSVSYVGTGTYGEANPNTLTFDFVPKIVSIQSTTTNFQMLLSPDVTLALSSYNGYCNNISWNGKTVSWYTTTNSANNQLNSAGVVYSVVAIG